MGFKSTIRSTLRFGLILTVFTWSAGWIHPIHSDSLVMARTDPEPIDHLFKAMGIIKLAGIAPPVDIELKDLNGQTIRVSDFKGKIVFLNFWATWCPDCRAEMPSMEKLFQRFKAREFVMVAVNLREPAKRVRTFFQKYNLSYTTLLDSKGRTAFPFGIRSIPTTFIINKKGGLIGKALGARAWDSESATALFEYLITHKASV